MSAAIIPHYANTSFRAHARARARARTRGVRQTAGGVSRRGWKFADGMFPVREDGEGAGGFSSARPVSDARRWASRDAPSLEILKSVRDSSKSLAVRAISGPRAHTSPFRKRSPWKISVGAGRARARERGEHADP